MVTTALRERMRAILRARNYSPRTEETYSAAVVHFARHFKTPPDQLGPEHVIAYQVWLRDQKRASHAGDAGARQSSAAFEWRVVVCRGFGTPLGRLPNYD